MEHSPTNPFPLQADKNKCIKCSTCPGVHSPGLQGVSDQTKCPHSPKKSEKLSPSGARSPYSPTGSAHYKISNSKHSPTSASKPSTSPEQQNCKHNLKPSKPQESSAKKSPLYSKNKHHTRTRDSEKHQSRSNPNSRGQFKEECSSRHLSREDISGSSRSREGVERSPTLEGWSRDLTNSHENMSLYPRGAGTSARRKSDNPLHYQDTGKMKHSSPEYGNFLAIGKECPDFNRQRRKSTPAIYLLENQTSEQTLSESISRLAIGTLNASSSDISQNPIRSGHRDIGSLFSSEDMSMDDGYLRLNLLNCPNTSTLQCDCGHINCPCCNLLMNLEVTDPSLLQ
ncbi:uncharacterized protein LOC111697697 [Eurytemora carolleeae]|uniref:uncharacterized protein LOC111697697 n=1 Tax=Eurytemora carolleeae TaxID=1294199 RepID=UPI000C78E422|nr:uncharacterized protein LOC111697697 [Eurytemora carolleeae]|eukprot:XP_023323555.1 uncharacterized protein LOC111697697 [Eurytemora affinis]